MSDTTPIERTVKLMSGDFTEADEPMRLFAAWLEDATKSEPRDPTAMTLATVDGDGMPDARMVLLKSADVHGFVFPLRNADGSFTPDALQQQAVADVIAFFDRYVRA